MATIVDVQGVTWEQFVTELFEYEYCHECEGDVEDHTPLLVLGNWFAQCKTERQSTTTVDLSNRPI